MKNILVMLTVVSMVGLSGCGQVSQDELDELKQKQSAQAAKIKAKDGEIEALQSQLDELQKNRTDYDDSELKARLAALETVEPVDNSSIEEALAVQDALIKKLVLENKNSSTAPDKPESAVENSQPEPIKSEFTEADQTRVDTLIPSMNSGAATAEDRDELVGLLQKADKIARTKAIDALKELVKKEPENKYARLALAQGMTTQFQDMPNGMAQGRHAGEIKTELDKAIEIDSEYYDAQHFQALFNVAYPTFLPEFKNADKQLDVVIALQADMTWENRFGEIYAGYGEWYQKQMKFDEGLAKVQEGLDKAPRHDGLLLRKESLLAAQTAADGE